MNFTPIGIYLIITLINFIFHIFYKKYWILGNILMISVITEIYTSSKTFNVIIPNIYVYLNQLCWFYLLFLFFKKIKTLHFIFLLYTFVFFIEFISNVNIGKFCSYSFVIGGITYVCFFLWESFVLLKNDRFDSFRSNDYILILAPILFFVGMCFLFGFDDNRINSIFILNGLTLYTFINYSVNFIYYSLINLYIYKEYKRNHV